MRKLRQGLEKTFVVAKSQEQSKRKNKQQNCYQKITRKLKLIKVNKQQALNKQSSVSGF